MPQFDFAALQLHLTVRRSPYARLHQHPALQASLTAGRWFLKGLHTCHSSIPLLCSSISLRGVRRMPGCISIRLYKQA